MKTRGDPSIESRAEGESVARVDSATDALVLACQRGKRWAQQRFYDQFRSGVYQIAVRMVGPNDAPDLLQQTFIQALRSIGQFAGQSHVRTWLYRLTVNECLQHLRKRRLRHSVRLKFDLLDRSPGHISQVDYKDILENALERLDPDLRAIFVLREIEKLSYAEIAEALEIPAGTVASRLNTARRTLKQILVELGWEP